MKNARRKTSNERGSALLLTLGILSLVLLLGMAFAFTARSNRQLAKINADNVQSRLVAESGLNSTIAYLRETAADNVYFPSTITATERGYADSAHNVGDDDFRIAMTPWGTDESEENRNSFSKILKANSDYVRAMLRGLDDNYLPDGFITIRGGNNANDPVIGRFGMLLIEESGKFDVNQLLSLTGKAPYANDNQYYDGSDDRDADDFYYNIEGNYTPCANLSYSDPDTIRLGIAMPEIRLTNRHYYSSLPNGGSGCKIPWMSYSHMLSDNSSTDFGKANDNGIFTYTFFSPKEEEEFWDGTSVHARFDITGFQWKHDDDYYSNSDRPKSAGSWDLPDSEAFAAYTDESYAQALVDGIAGSGNAATGLTNIPYLSGKKQVAANLVDYSDSDDYATTDLTDFDLDGILAGTTALPQYFGNEKVFYINELGFRFQATWSAQPEVLNGTVRSKQYTFSLYMKHGCELINIFQDTVPACNVSYRANIAVSDTFAPTATCELTSSNTPPSYITFSGNCLSSSDFFRSVGSAENTAFSNADLLSQKVITVSTTDPDADLPLPEFAFKVSLSKIAAITTADSRACDFAYWAAGEGDKEIFDSGENWASDNPMHICESMISLEAKDPRCNYTYGNNSNNWSWTSASEDGSSTSMFTSSGAMSEAPNSCLVDQNGTSADKEGSNLFTGSNTYSTAFIRNAPIESLWELGVIHRGQPGCTLNLAKFSDVSAMPSDWADGDAAILDQVKIGPAVSTRGKYNANAFNPPVLALLMNGIEDTPSLDFDYDNHIYSSDDFDNSTPSRNRGAFVNKLKPIIEDLSGNADNDVAREAFIGRTANLLSTRYESYTIAIVGQALRELDSEIDSDEAFNAVKPMLHNPTKYNVGSSTRYCDILGTQVILAHVVRDTLHNTFKVIQTEYL